MCKAGVVKTTLERPLMSVFLRGNSEGGFQFLASALTSESGSLLIPVSCFLLNGACHRRCLKRGYAWYSMDGGDYRDILV